MAIRLGQATIKVNGEELETMPGASLDIGGKKRTPVMGGNGKVLGPSTETVPAILECEISVGPDTRLQTLAATDDATVTFACDTGQVYVINHAFVTETLKLTAAEGGKVPVKFAGEPAQEMTS